MRGFGIIRDAALYAGHGCSENVFCAGLKFVVHQSCSFIALSVRIVSSVNPLLRFVEPESECFLRLLQASVLV